MFSSGVITSIFMIGSRITAPLQLSNFSIPILAANSKRAHQNRQGEKIRQLKSLSNYPLDNQPKDPFS
jgi:hypothetical protein